MMSGFPTLGRFCIGALVVASATALGNVPGGRTDVTYTHDRLGRPVTITDVLGTRTNVYDVATLALSHPMADMGGIPSQAPLASGEGVETTGGGTILPRKTSTSARAGWMPCKR